MTFDAMRNELFGMPFDVLESVVGDETIISDCRKTINEAIANRQNPLRYPAYHTLQDHCSWEDEPSPLDLDEDNDDDWDGSADVDLLARVGLLGGGASNDNGAQLDDDLPF